MWRLANSLLLLTSLGCAARCSQDPEMAYGFDTIEPSTNLSWTPCFDNFECARLEVPWDYSNHTTGTTAIAFIKLAGKNATDDSPTIVINPGGPSGSGVQLLIDAQALAGQAFGDQVNLVSYDPRGVSHSGPGLDCFSGDEDARAAFNRLHRTGPTNVSSTSLVDQYYSSAIYGEWCNKAVENDSPHGYYVTTPAVARDLLTFIEAEAEAAGKSASDAKLWMYGISYGTVVGATFASMFPDRVERMVLDGVVNAEQYYSSDWRDNVEQMDEAMVGFSTICHAAGSEGCPFWGPTPDDIMDRLDALITQLQNHPVPVSGAQSGDLPQMVTVADLKTLFITSVYNPQRYFPDMAEALHQLEQGNVTALVGLYDKQAVTSDTRLTIQCADAYRTNKLTTIDEFKSHVEYTSSKSKYMGDIYPLFVEDILCRSIRPQLPDSMVVQDPKIGLDEPMAYPILFTSNTIDPITPAISARTMSSRFPGSIVLLQEAIGHTVIDQGGSICYFEHVQAYFQGVVPPSNITCSQQ